MGLGKRISELRKRQGMTQEQLAQHLGTTRQAISKWESDKSEPDVATLVRLGTLFNVSMDYLLLGKESTGYHQACSRREPIDNKKHWVIPFYMSINIRMISFTFSQKIHINPQVPIAVTNAPRKTIPNIGHSFR